MVCNIRLECCRRGTGKSNTLAPGPCHVCMLGDLNESRDDAMALEAVDVVVHLAARVEVMKESAKESRR